MRTLIINGLIYDGSGSNPYKKNLVIENDKIAGITDSMDTIADIEINAEGLVVTPGFIDTHRHCDIAALYDKNFGELELAQGLTSVIGGNCGLAPVPTVDRSRQDVYDYIEPCLGIAPLEMKMDQFSDYIKALENTSIPIHMGSFMGIGAIKAAVKGYDKTPFTVEEIKLSQNYISEGMQAGAFGLSMGIMYQPECYSTKDEIVRMLSAATPFQRPLTCHIRGEGHNLVPSVKEIIEIANRAELPLNISHFKATGIKNWGKNIHQAIEVVEEARAKGQDITVDFYPYCGGSTTLLSLLPPSIIQNTLEETLKKVATKIGKEELKRELYKEHLGWDNMVTSIGWERILISSVTKEKNREFSGRNFYEVAISKGYSDPCDFFGDLLVEEQGKVGIIVLSMSQDDVDTVARLPYSMVISDSLYGKSDCPHPRLYGSFPKVIREYVIERKILTLEKAIHKMTYLPAKRLQISERGMLSVGNYADINIFNLCKLTDHAVYEKPKQLCTGFNYILIDGKIVLDQDKKFLGHKANILKFQARC